MQALAEVLETSNSRRRLGWLSDTWDGVVEVIGDEVIDPAGAWIEGAIADVGQAILTPITALINGIKTQIENLFDELTVFFRQAIESLLATVGDVGRLVADVVKGAMQGLNENCGVEIPSCLIGPPEGCEDESSPVWESTIMTLSVSHFHSCCA